MWDCQYIFEGTDLDGTKWYRCTTHDELALSPDSPCAGYYAPDYEPEGDFSGGSLGDEDR